MKSSKVRALTLVAVALVSTSVMFGCGAGGSFPETLPLELLDSTVIDATLGGGAPSLANSEWVFYRRNANGDRGALLLRIPFGPEGNLVSFEDNTLATQVFGQTIILDGQKHDTAQEGLSYAAATYGGESESGLGFAAQLTAYYSVLQVAEGEASAIGEFLDEDTIVGTFSFNVEVSDLAESFVGSDMSQEDEFEFIAYRQ